MSEAVPFEFVRMLAPVLRQAASVARELEGRVANRPKEGEVDAVKAALTAADTATQEAILVPLLEHFPEVGVEAEEDTRTVARFPARRDPLVVIDPIDGTLRCYLEARGPYTVLIGLAIENVYQAALIALPREGLFFEALRGAGARVTGADEQPLPARAERDGSRLLVSHDLGASAVEKLRVRGYEVSTGSGGAIAIAPLLPGVCGGLRVPRRSRSVSIRGRIGLLAATEAGALARTESGAPFPITLDEPARTLLVGAGEEEIDALREAVATLAL